MSAKGSSRTCSSKPVNINISFTINPKNILNKQSESSDTYFIFQYSGFKMKKGVISEVQTIKMERQILQYKAKTPDLPFTDRVQFEKQFNEQEKKQKVGKKRNSIDQSFLYGVNKKNESINLQKFQQSFHFRKTSLKAKKQSDSVIKRKHNKTASKHSVGDNPTMKNTIVQSLSNEQRTNYKKNLKNMINSMMKNQFSKRSLPIAMPTQQLKTARKKKLGNRKQLKAGQSQYLLNKKNNEEDNLCIEKFASIRSMNNSIFKSEQDEEYRPRSRRTININTDQSIDCINEIHDMQKANRQFCGMDVDRLGDNMQGNYEDTKKLINNLLGNLNNESQRQEQTENKILKKKMLEKFDGLQNQRLLKKKDKKVQPIKSDQKGESLRVAHEYLKNQDFLRPFCSSQMTKQQKMINEIERVKLTSLKKHEVMKWGQLLTYIKKSMNEGKVNHDQILLDIYQFLQQTKMDLQKQINKPQRQHDDLDDFTNKFSSNQLKVNEQKMQVFFEDSKQMISMKQKEEMIGQQNEQLKLMNLEMIQNALKARHDSLIDKMNRDIANLDEQRNVGKILQEQYEKQKERLDKWTKKQTGEIMQARKNIWKGYNEAKGIIQKSLKSRYFQQESAKKKSMMKCLSQDYLVKSYKHKKLIQHEQKNDESSESSEYDYDYGNDQVLQKKQPFHKQLHCSSENEQEEDESQEESIQKQFNEDLNGNENEVDQGNGQVSYNCGVEDNDDYEGVVIENKRKRYIESEFNLNKQCQQQKQFNELKELTKQSDINMLKQKLHDIKQRHFNSDNQQSYESGDISYEEIDKEIQDKSVSEDQMRLISYQLNKGKVIGGLVQCQYEKLKNVGVEDKEDIFEFIFLDLSIELYQEPCYGNKIMNCINDYVNKMKKQANKRKGIKTNLNVVKQYLKRFIGFIMRAHKNALDTLDEPVGPSALEMLRYMHDNDDQAEGEEEPPSPLIIPSYVFDLFENSFLPSIEFETYYENDDDRENRRVQFLKNVLHIHNKAIFDAMNEYLDLLRPYGLWGKPFPWKSSSTFQHLTTSEQKQQKLKKTNDKIIQHCSYVCGLLIDKQESLVGNAKLSQEYIHQIKEDRLSRMLATELMQNEQRWVFYDDEETQVMVQISAAIHMMLVKEVMEDIGKILYSC